MKNWSVVAAVEIKFLACVRLRGETKINKKWDKRGENMKNELQRVQN